MAGKARTKVTSDVGTADTTTTAASTASSEECNKGMLGCSMGKKGIKGMVLMAACCGAPVLLLLALPLIGSALGSVGVSALNTLAVLACPVGMALMMWLMMRGQQAGPLQTGAVSVEPPASVPQASSETAEAIGRSVSIESEGTVELLHHSNGHRTALPVSAVSGQQEAVPAPADSRTRPAVLSDT